VPIQLCLSLLYEYLLVLALRCVGDNAVCSRHVLRWRSAIDYDGVWPEILRRYVHARSGACSPLGPGAAPRLSAAAAPIALPPALHL